MSEQRTAGIPDEVNPEDAGDGDGAGAITLSSRSIFCRGTVHLAERQVVMFTRPLALPWDVFLLQAAESGWMYNQAERDWRCPECVAWYRGLVSDGERTR